MVSELGYWKVNEFKLQSTFPIVYQFQIGMPIVQESVLNSVQQKISVYFLCSSVQLLM